jgi:hypothetical protein
MIEEFITVLRRADLKPTSEELGDVLWLSAWVGPLMGLTGAGRSGAAASGGVSRPGKPPRSQQAQAISQSTVSSSSSVPDSPSIDVYQAGADSSKVASKGGVSVWSPSAPGLPSALELGRALRPLKRRVPSKTQFTVDEEETARRIAEDIPFPLALCPMLTRWLDVVLVVDENSSMRIWQQTLHELHSLLERHGAFRQVLRRGVSTEGHGEPRLCARFSHTTQRRFEWRELIEPSGRRLILLVSDCVSVAWADGRMGSLVRN